MVFLKKKKIMPSGSRQFYSLISYVNSKMILHCFMPQSPGVKQRANGEDMLVQWVEFIGSKKTQTTASVDSSAYSDYGCGSIKSLLTNKFPLLEYDLYIWFVQNYHLSSKVWLIRKKIHLAKSVCFFFPFCSDVISHSAWSETAASLEIYSTH